MSKVTKGFTLVELIIVIAIIGILSSTVLARINTIRENAQTTRAQADLSTLRLAIDILTMDTGLLPTFGATKIEDSGCVWSGSGNELYLNTPDAGLESTDGNFPGWRGPYVSSMPTDPWGTDYIFDSDYECTASPLQEGCEDHSGDTVRVVHSAGPNKSAINAYDSDDIVLVLCGE